MWSSSSTPRMHRALVSWLPALLLSGCGGEAPAPSPSAQASSQPAAAVSATLGAGDPAAAKGAAPSAAPASTASAAAPSFEETPEPALSEWATSTIVTVKGSSKNSCDTRMVREWLRVQCVNRSAERGVPVSIEVTRGRAPKERYQGENLSVVNDITTLIVPVRPGTDFAATFNWAKGTDELAVKWPTGTPESAREMVFASASASADGAAGVAGAVPEPAPPAEAQPEEPQADIEGIEAEPSADDWSKAPEARVKGSTAAGCETKLVGAWFRARCEASAGGKPVQALVPLKGHKATQTKVTIEEGVATLVTPYASGTEMHARFVREGEAHVLVLRWPTGPQPSTIGAFEKPR